MTQPDPDFVAFLRAYPTYPTTHIIDDLRATEYARLDVGGHIYLDYTGGGLYAESQLRRHNKLLAEHVFGNPHSSNPTSQAATQLVEHARQYVLKFFNAELNARNLLCVLLAALFPGQVYFHAVFPISLSVLCTLGCLYGMARERWILAGVCGAAVTWVYSLGFLMIPVLACGVVLTARGRPRSASIRLAGAVVLTAMGYALMMGFFGFITPC